LEATISAAVFVQSVQLGAVHIVVGVCFRFPRLTLCLHYRLWCV